MLAMAWEIKSNWEVLAAAAAVAVLLLSAWTEIIDPMRRRRALKRPCRAFFHINEYRLGDLGYVVQDDEAHNVKEIVLPSNSEVEVEVAYCPTIPFRVHRSVFGVDGDPNDKPLPLERFTRFVAEGKGKAHWIPGVDPTDSIDRWGNYHYDSQIPGRAVDSWYTMGFKLKTQSAGVYKAWIGFLTDEVDGNGLLSIRVEDSPRTRMTCSSHRACKVRPSGPGRIGHEICRYRP